jgi:alkylhydroperoxidase/carboxymuconolactone decarboxylase family protein YurZ
LSNQDVPWQATGNYDLEWIRFMEQHAPDACGALRNWIRASQVRHELDEKTAEFIIVALDAHVAWPEPFIDIHINKAFNAGSTVLELVEVLTTAGMTMGPHLLNHGMTALRRTVEQREALGLATPYRRP